MDYPAINIILAAVDETERAEGVLRMATAIAERFASRLYLYRALSVPPDFPPAARTEHGDPLPSYLEGQARSQLRALVGRVPGAELALPLVNVGDSWRAILEMAAKLGADMIVIGRHRYQGLDHVLGTTSGRVSMRANCHVVIVGQHPG